MRNQCPVCDGKVESIAAEKYQLFECIECHELLQIVGEAMVPLGGAMIRNKMGDDRVRAAISRPRVTDLDSFVSVFEGINRMMQFDMFEASGSLRTIVAQAESRIDFALSKLAGLDLASDEAHEVLEALRDARDLISPRPAAHNLKAKKEGVDAPQGKHKGG